MQHPCWVTMQLYILPLSDLECSARRHVCTAIATKLIKEYIYALLFVRSGVQVYVEGARDLATPHAATSTGQAMVTVSCVSGWNVYMPLGIYCSVQHMLSAMLRCATVVSPARRELPRMADEPWPGLRMRFEFNTETGNCVYTAVERISPCFVSIQRRSGALPVLCGGCTTQRPNAFHCICIFQGSHDIPSDRGDIRWHRAAVGGKSPACVHATDCSGMPFGALAGIVICCRSSGSTPPDPLFVLASC